MYMASVGWRVLSLKYAASTSRRNTSVTSKNASSGSPMIGARAILSIWSNVRPGRQLASNLKYALFHSIGRLSGCSCSPKFEPLATAVQLEYAFAISRSQSLCATSKMPEAFPNHNAAA